MLPSLHTKTDEQRTPYHGQGTGGIIFEPLKRGETKRVVTGRITAAFNEQGSAHHEKKQQKRLKRRTN